MNPPASGDGGTEVDDFLGEPSSSSSKPPRDRDDHQQIQHVDDLEDSEPSKRVKAKKIPPDVSQDEHDQHILTHFPFRAWCTFCLKGKTRKDAHHKREVEASSTPRFSLDYMHYDPHPKTFRN